jgi:trehalose synthase
MAARARERTLTGTDWNGGSRSSQAESIKTETRRLASYRGLASAELLDAVRAAAEPLRGLRVLHLNATAYGGGVAELLHSVVPLLRDLGLAAEWKVLSAEKPFFEVTKALHSGLQGGDFAPPARCGGAYEATCELNVPLVAEDYDVVVVHDPQPAGVLPLRGKGGTRWIWRCHIDTAAPNPDAWAFLRPFLHDYDAAVFTLADFVPADLPIRQVDVIPPAIDPLSEKNAELPERRVAELTRGLDLDGPLVTQVSRFDPWKDPAGVVEAFRLAREELPELRLALAGSMADDDPEGWRVFEEIRSACDGDAHIRLLTNLDDTEVNALQRVSAVCIQKSVREGFGLVVSEATWKRTPVVAGRTGGIPLQMADGTGGLLVDDVPGCARAIVELVTDRARAKELAHAGSERVRNHFLLPRLLLNELSLLQAVVGGATASAQPPMYGRDPVCGIAVVPTDRAAENGGTASSFCSRACRDAFFADPGRYAHRRLTPLLRRGSAGSVGNLPHDLHEEGTVRAG